jgi:subtilisin family serine protease
MKARLAFLSALVAAVLAGSGPATSATAREVTVGYRSAAGLSALLARHHAVVVRRLPALRTVQVVTRDANGLRREPNVRFVESAPERGSTAEPALAPGAAGIAYEWQYAATGADRVPEWVRQAASAVTIAVVDTGADLRAPDLAAKAPVTYNVATRKARARDDVGHGTFVASLAAGSDTNGEGVAGFGGDARLMVVKANRGPRRFDVVDEAAGIVWAVDHGARIVNLSLGGPVTARVEREAVDYAVTKGVLLVAAAGNEHRYGDPPEYPAALLQPPGSNGAPGRGLSVGASTRAGARASFSTAGAVTLAAPGVHVLGALARGTPLGFQSAVLPGSLAGSYGYGSGTSYAAPQVAGAAALVWAANPTLTTADVADVVRRSASGGGTWNSDIGYGVLDVANAVASAGAPL